MDGQGSDNLREPAPTIDRLNVYKQLVRLTIIIRVASVAQPVDHDLGDEGRVGLNLLFNGRRGALGALEPRLQRCVLASLVLKLRLQFQDPFPQSVVFLLKLLLSNTSGQEAGHQKYRSGLIRRALERHV